MLCLTRKKGQSIRINDDITVKVLSIKRGMIRLGIEAPSDVPVHRGEVYERIQEEKAA